MVYEACYVDAFNHAMIYEVGSWFNPSDLDTIAGKCETTQQQRKVGFTDIAEDRGGVTKFGIAQNMSPDIDVQNITLSDAMMIIYDGYWLLSKCDKIDNKGVAIMHFDAAINNGNSASVKMTQKCVGAVVDGIIGQTTIALINKFDAKELIKSLADARMQRYNAIIEKNPSQKKFFNGWCRRVQEVTQFALNKC